MLLALETATDLVGAAPCDRDGGVAERSHLGGRAHAELLAPAIEEVCALSGCTLADVDAVAVDVGPGLFTGLRVGVATAKALGQALGLGVLGVSSLDVLAAGAVEAAPVTGRARVVAVVDARRGEVFAAAYALRPGRRRPDGPDPAAVRTDRPRRPVPRGPGRLVRRPGRRRAGAGGRGRRRALPGPLAPRPGPRPRPGRRRWPPRRRRSWPAWRLRRLAAGAVTAAPADVVPDYRRPADARINWEERAPQRTAPARRASPDGPGDGGTAPRGHACRWWWHRCAPAT